MIRTSLHSAWLGALHPYPWEVFLTLTFSKSRMAGGTSSEGANRAYRRLVRFVNEKLYGRRWLRTTKHKGIVWVRIEEGHADGMLHYHACFYSPSVQISPELIKEMQVWWRQRFGLAEAEAPKSRMAVLRYLLKSLLRSAPGELDLSHNFPRFL